MTTAHQNGSGHKSNGHQAGDKKKPVRKPKTIGDKKVIYAGVLGDSPGIQEKHVNIDHKNSEAEFDSFGEAKKYVISIISKEIDSLSDVRHKVWSLKKGDAKK